MNLDSLDAAALWPRELNLSTGFTDDELWWLSRPELGRSERPKLSSPWLFWSSEMYSHGVLLREMFGWPKELPLPAYSDHGIHFSEEFASHERKNAARVHFCWSSWRPTIMATNQKKRIFHLPHPWVWKRSTERFTPRSDASGGILFVPHGLPRKTRNFDWERHFDLLFEGATDPAPRAICLAMHDIRNGVHQELRQFGLPIFTVGDTASPAMFMRFYDLLSRFSWSSSWEIGTHSFLSEDFGVTFFYNDHRHVLRKGHDSSSSSEGARIKSYEDLFRPENLDSRPVRKVILARATNSHLLGMTDLEKIRQELLLALALSARKIGELGMSYLGKKYRRAFSPRGEGLLRPKD